MVPGARTISKASCVLLINAGCCLGPQLGALSQNTYMIPLYVISTFFLTLWLLESQGQMPQQRVRLRLALLLGSSLRIHGASLLLHFTSIQRKWNQTPPPDESGIKDSGDMFLNPHNPSLFNDFWYIMFLTMLQLKCL